MTSGKKYGKSDFDRVMKEYPIGKKIRIRGDECIEDHVVSSYTFGEFAMYVELEAGGRFHADRLREMEVKGIPGESIISMLTKTAEEICDGYCKYPGSCTSDEELQDICEQCPITMDLGL